VEIPKRKFKIFSWFSFGWKSFWGG
jgi:hypothetical protein